MKTNCIYLGFIKIEIFGLLILFGVFGWALNGRSQTILANDICKVRIGTLELIQDKAIFRWGGGNQEIYDHSPASITGSVGPQYIPGIHEVGFETLEGKSYFYDGVPKSNFLLKFFNEHPEEKGIQCFFYEGEDGKLVKIEAKGQTVVVRIDVGSGDLKITPWQIFWRRLEKGELDKLIDSISQKK